MALRDHNNHPPALFSTTRIVALLCALSVSLASGTNYAFSVYAPQLAQRLHLSHTQQNIVGLAGNVGVYATAPIWGRIVDTRGPRILLIIGFVSLLAGYSGIRYFFDKGLSSDQSNLSTLNFCILVLCGFLTGIGGNGGLTSSVNSTAKSFPDRLRASATGLVISGFGLSAFLFSTIAHIAFPGNTSDLLLLLAIGTSSPMVLGYFFVRPIPLPYSEVMESLESRVSGEHEHGGISSPRVYGGHNSSHTHLLSGHNADEGSDEEVLEASVELHPQHQHEASNYLDPGTTNSGMFSPSESSGRRHRSRSSVGSSRGLHGIELVNTQPNIHGRALAFSKRFWVLASTMCLISGTGLMYINNVGSISQALFAKGNPDFDEKKALKWQATQVSTISICNFSGRIIIGLLADLTKSKAKLPRSFCMSLVTSGFIISQIMAYFADDVKTLWKTSAVLGLSYGGLFGLFPMVTFEWFGMQHFSENWGFVSLSPIIGGNVFSMIFGRNLDAHGPAEPQDSTNSTISNIVTRSVTNSISPLLSRTTDTHQCLQGRECYVASLKVTIAACTLALCLSIYAGWKDWEKQKSQRVLEGRMPVPTSDVLFGDEDD